MNLHPKKILITGITGFVGSHLEQLLNYYRLNNHAEFLQLLNLNEARAYPMMSRDWQVNVLSSSDLEESFDILSCIKVSNESLFNVSKNGDTSLFVSTAITRSINDDENIIFNGKTLGRFVNFFSNIAIKSGHHIKEGSLWLSFEKAGFPMASQEPLTKLFPMTLSAMGLQQNDVLVKERVDTAIG